MVKMKKYVPIIEGEDLIAYDIYFENDEMVAFISETKKKFSIVKSFDQKQIEIACGKDPEIEIMRLFPEYSVYDELKYSLAKVKKDEKTEEAAKSVKFDLQQGICWPTVCKKDVLSTTELHLKRIYMYIKNIDLNLNVDGTDFKKQIDTYSKKGKHCVLYGPSQKDKLEIIRKYLSLLSICRNERMSFNLPEYGNYSFQAFKKPMQDLGDTTEYKDINEGYNNMQILNALGVSLQKK